MINCLPGAREGDELPTGMPYGGTGVVKTLIVETAPRGGGHRSFSLAAQTISGVEFTRRTQEATAGSWSRNVDRDQSKSSSWAH